jgi:Spy/CpxP family protein refolding chaperone
MKIGKLIAAALLAASMIGGMSISASAQEKSCCNKDGQQQPTCQQGGKGCKIPDLTADQQKQIDALKATMMKDRLQLTAQIQEKKAHLKTLTITDQPDMAAINKTVDELYALKAELAKKKEAHIQDVRKILTPEQRLQFDMMHAKMDCDGKGKCGDGAQGCGPQSGQGCQNQGAGCQNQGQGCQKQGQGCQNQQGGGQGCQKQGQGCQNQQGGGQGCQKQGQGCQNQQGGGQGCQKQNQGCQHQQQGDDKK